MELLTSLAAGLARRVLVAAEPPHRRSLSELAGALVWSLTADLERGLAPDAGAPAGYGTGFGGPWPYWLEGEQLMTPAVPTAVVTSGEVAAGGSYRREGERVLREAGSRETLVLGSAAEADRCEPPFEALWFAGEERCRLFGGRLWIEDLFTAVVLPCDAAAMAGAIEPERRAALSEALAHPPQDAASGEPATITVARPSDLLPPRTWREPAAVAAVRSDIDAVHLEGDELVVRRVGAAGARFRVTLEANGWELTRIAGEDLFDRLSLTHEEERVVLTALPDRRVDLCRRRQRVRMGFDLGALLVAVATQNE